VVRFADNNNINTPFVKNNAQLDERGQVLYIVVMQSEVNLFSKTIKSEKSAINYLATHLGVSKKDIKHLTLDNPSSLYDLQFKNTRFDVKYSSPTKSRNNLYWDFDLRYKGADYCDFFVFLGMWETKVKKVFLVPVKEVTTFRRIRVSILGNSKYNKYII